MSSNSFNGAVMDAFVNQDEFLSPQEFVHRYTADKSSVRGARFQPPKAGSKSFGKFVIRRPDGVYEVLVNERKFTRRKA